ENCVAHNGSLIPIPGRDIMAQAWYQGGISVFEWTDPAHPREIAFFDRGPADTTLKLSGSWSAYWYNGVIVSSEITRGLDVFELAPSAKTSRPRDRKSTRLNSSHVAISYAVFCLKKKKTKTLVLGVRGVVVLGYGRYPIIYRNGAGYYLKLTPPSPQQL